MYNIYSRAVHYIQFRLHTHTLPPPPHTVNTDTIVSRNSHSSPTHPKPHTQCIYIHPPSNPATEEYSHRNRNSVARRTEKNWFGGLQLREQERFEIAFKWVDGGRLTKRQRETVPSGWSEDWKRARTSWKEFSTRNAERQAIGRRTKYASRGVDLKTVREIDRGRVVDALVAEGVDCILDSLWNRKPV